MLNTPTALSFPPHTQFTAFFLPPSREKDRQAAKHTLLCAVYCLLRHFAKKHKLKILLFVCFEQNLKKK